MHQHSQRSQSADTGVGDERRRNQQPVAKTVDAVAQQHRPTSCGPLQARDRGVRVRVRMGVWGVVVVRRMWMRVGMTLRVTVCVCIGATILGRMVFVPVVPQFGLVQHKKQYQAAKEQHAQRFGGDTTFKGFRDQVYARGAQQGPCGKAQHVRGILAGGARAEQCCQQDAANAGNEGADEDVKH